MKKFGSRNFAGRSAFPIDQCRAERDGHQCDLRRRIGVGERAAHGSAGADGSVADKGHDLGEQRHRSADQGIVLDHALARGGADRDRVAVMAHEGKIGDAGDVDQPLRPGEPHGHERDEGLASGDDPCVVAGGEHGASLVEIRGSGIFKGSGFHRACFGFVNAVSAGAGRPAGKLLLS